MELVIIRPHSCFALLYAVTKQRLFKTEDLAIALVICSV
jgi:hypothetical protein